MSEIVILIVILVVALACAFRLLDWLLKRNFDGFRANATPDQNSVRAKQR